MKTRDAHLGRLLRATLRASRWSADVIAFRASVGRSVMARALVGDTSLTLHQYELVAEQLEVHLDFAPWSAAGAPPAPGRVVETVVDRARRRMKPHKLTDLPVIISLVPGTGHVSIDDMSR